MESSFSLKVGTASGLLLSIAPNVMSSDLLRTAMLAVVGTIVSFIATLILQWITGFKKK